MSTVKEEVSIVPTYINYEAMDKVMKWMTPKGKTTVIFGESFIPTKVLGSKVSTQEVTNYTRNKVKNIVIPYIKKEFNPNIIESINRLSEVATETDEYIDNKIKKVYEEIKISEKENSIILNLKEFNTKDTLIQKKLLIYTISKTIGNTNNIEKINIEDIIKLCRNNLLTKEKFFLIPQIKYP